MESAILLKFKFDIGDRVYHVIPESTRGIVTDITWRKSSDIIWYHITFDPGVGEIPCRDFELSTEKTII